MWHTKNLLVWLLKENKTQSSWPEKNFWEDISGLSPTCHSPKQDAFKRVNSVIIIILKYYNFLWQLQLLNLQRGLNLKKDLKNSIFWPLLVDQRNTMFFHGKKIHVNISVWRIPVIGAITYLLHAVWTLWLGWSWYFLLQSKYNQSKRDFWCFKYIWQRLFPILPQPSPDVKECDVKFFCVRLFSISAMFWFPLSILYPHICFVFLFESYTVKSVESDGRKKAKLSL